MRDRPDLLRRVASIAAISVAFIALGLGGGRAAAQSAEAEALFNDGVKLMTQGDLARACDAFQASNQVEPRAGTLIRLGECHEKNQQLASAWSAYRDALTRVKDPRKREYATAKAAALEARLSYLTMSVVDASRVDGLTLTRDGKPFAPALWNRALPVDGGDYVIVGHAPGREDWRTTTHVPIEGAKIIVDVPRLQEPGKRSAPAAPARTPASQASPSPTPPSTSPPVEPPAARHPAGDAEPSHAMFTTRREVAVGLASATVVGVVAAVVLGESSRAKQSDAYKLCPDPATPCPQGNNANALIRASHSRALDANVALGIAGAAAIGAGVLWLTGAPVAESPRRISVAPTVGRGDAGLVVTGRF